MAYTKTPEAQTYSTHKVPIATTINTRNVASTDFSGSFMVNLIPFKMKGIDGEEKIVAQNRQPIKAMKVSASELQPRGCFVWEKAPGTIYYFAVCGTSVFTSTNMTTWAAVDTLLTDVDTPVRFTEFIDSTNVKKLVLVDGVEGYVYTSNAAGTKITDADFPTPHIPFPVFVDGYLFLAKSATGDIYNSNLNDPALWTAGDFISSELYPDDLQAIVKVNNYILAIGTLGCEYFYDAGNATGTPLARQEGGSLPFGCPTPNSIAYNKDTVVFIANSSDGAISIRAVEGFKHKDITPPWLTSLLSYSLKNSYITNPEVVGYFIRQEGQLGYVLNIISFDRTIASVGSFLYSFETGYWVQLSSDVSTSPTYRPSDYWPVRWTAFGSTQDPTTFVLGITRLVGNTIRYPFFGKLGISLAAGANFNDGYQDQFNGTEASGKVDMTVEVQTDLLSFGTLNQKAMHRLGFNMSTSGSGAGAGTLTLSWSDDWYGTWTTRTSALDIIYSNTFPMITQLGSFRTRALRWSVTSIYNTLYDSMEFDINKGQQ